MRRYKYSILMLGIILLLVVTPIIWGLQPRKEDGDKDRYATTPDEIYNKKYHGDYPVNENPGINYSGKEQESHNQTSENSSG